MICSNHWFIQELIITFVFFTEMQIRCRDAPPPPPRKKKAVVFTTVTTSAYQDQLNTGFSKVCEIFKVLGIESLKYVREFYTPVCYCDDISTPLNMTRHKTKHDWLLYLSVIWLLGRALANESATIHSRPSAVSLKVWLCETNGAFPLHGTTRYGSVRFTFGGFSTGYCTWYLVLF